MVLFTPPRLCRRYLLVFFTVATATAATDGVIMAVVGVGDVDVDCVGVGDVALVGVLGVSIGSRWWW